MIKKILIFFICIILVTSIGAAYATWYYANKEVNPVEQKLVTVLDKFTYDPQDIPEGEASILQRLGDILNYEYEVEGISDIRKFLFDETICQDWEGSSSTHHGKYVGSMDSTYKEQINLLFGDITQDANVNFILKNEDLNWDSYTEIAIYSTSDPLDWVGGHLGIVGVYLTVFTPIVDDQGNVLRYELLCDSIHGYCPEVNYKSSDNTPSFSTDDWVDELSYWHHEEPYLRTLPPEARYDYECYHSHHYQYEGAPYIGAGWIERNGKTASERLGELFAELQR